MINPAAPAYTGQQLYDMYRTTGGSDPGPEWFQLGKPYKIRWERLAERVSKKFHTEATGVRATDYLADRNIVVSADVAEEVGVDLPPLSAPSSGVKEPGFANNMVATELRAGDVFYIGGQYETPGQAKVLNRSFISEKGEGAVVVKVAIPKDHVFDYVCDRQPH